MKLLWNPGGRRDLISRETSYLFGTVRLKLPTSIMIIQYMIQLPFVLKRFCLLPPKSLWGNLCKVSVAEYQCYLLYYFLPTTTYLCFFFIKLENAKRLTSSMTTFDVYTFTYLTSTKYYILNLSVRSQISTRTLSTISLKDKVMICELTLTCLVIMI